MSWVDQHPYKIYVDGLLRAHFSNLRCAARTLKFHDFDGKYFRMLTEDEKARRWVCCGELRVDYKECMGMT